MAASARSSYRTWRSSIARGVGVLVARVGAARLPETVAAVGICHAGHRAGGATPTDSAVASILPTHLREADG
jgi:hypothetical protein